MLANTAGANSPANQNPSDLSVGLRSTGGVVNKIPEFKLLDNDHRLASVDQGMHLPLVLWLSLARQGGRCSCVFNRPVPSLAEQNYVSRVAIRFAAKRDGVEFVPSYHNSE